MADVHPDVVKKINELSTIAMPTLSMMASLLRGSKLTEFDLLVNDSGDRFHWSSGIGTKKPLNQSVLEAEILNVLNREYASEEVMLMGMVYSPNRAIAQEIAMIVAEQHRRDRREIENDISALLMAFKSTNQ